MKKFAIFLIAMLLIGTSAACQDSTVEEVYDIVCEEAQRAAAELANNATPSPEQAPEERPLERAEAPPSARQAEKPLHPGDAIAYDLTGLVLFNHNLGSSALFEYATLYSQNAETDVQVLVFQGDATRMGGTFIESSRGGIELFYEFEPDQTAMTFIADVMEFMELATDDEYAPSEIGPIRVSADEQTAAVAVLGPEGYDEIAVMLVQNMPGTDGAAMLVILLSRMSWGAGDDAALTELGTYLGVDLHKFVAAWL